MPKENPNHTEALRVNVKHVISFNEESGFCIMACRDNRNHKHKVIGHYHEDPSGQDIVAHGNFEVDEKYGTQFKAVYIEPGELISPDRVATYLASMGIPGIGLEISKNIALRFGSLTFDIIDTDPDRLLEAPRVPQKAVDYIHQNWRGLDRNRELVMFLLDVGVNPKLVPEVRRKLGFRAAELIEEDPYILSRHIKGIGFGRADAIARRFGIEKHSPVRKRAIFEKILFDADCNGACAVPLEEVLSKATKELGVPRGGVAEHMQLMIYDEQLICEKMDGVDVIYDPDVIRTEKNIANMLLYMVGKKPPWERRGMDIDAAINKHGRMLGSDQSNAVSTILCENISVMTGGPGVGKTTTLKTALNIFEDYGVGMALCAPTGMAAKRMREATGRGASTIHSLLEVDGEDGSFRRNANNPIDADIVVVDESSMTDIRLMSSLLKAIGPETSLLIVGDVDQLPSVGPGRVLHDIIASGAVPVSRLTQVFRQAEGSLIINAAHAINRGAMPDDRPVGVPGGDLDFLFLDIDSSHRVEDIVLELICNRLKNHSLLQDGYDPIRDVMVVAAQKDPTAGVRNLNLKLRAELNPLPNQGSINRLDVHALNDEGMVSFGVGDKIMNTANKFDKGIVNGDIGYIRNFDHLKKGMFVEFDCGLVELDKSDVRDQQLAYANTVHKSQGSESKVLIMPVVNEFGRMLQRNLIYTGLTRAKTLGIIVGQRSALERAVANTQNQQRWSFTGEALRRSLERPEEDYGVGF